MNIYRTLGHEELAICPQSKSGPHRVASAKVNATELATGDVPVATFQDMIVNQILGNLGAVRDQANKHPIRESPSLQYPPKQLAPDDSSASWTGVGPLGRNRASVDCAKSTIDN